MVSGIELVRPTVVQRIHCNELASCHIERGKSRQDEIQHLLSDSFALLVYPYSQMTDIDGWKRGLKLKYRKIFVLYFGRRFLNEILFVFRIIQDDSIVCQREDSHNLSI